MLTLMGTELAPLARHNTRVVPKVVVIEDDESALHCVARLLRRSGCSVVPETRGERGVMTAIFAEPDLILLDLGLPGVRGEDALKLLYENIPHIPVVLVTGSAQAKSFADTWSNVVGFFVKPYDSSLLAAMVEDLLGIPQAAVGEQRNPRLPPVWNRHFAEVWATDDHCLVRLAAQPMPCQAASWSPSSHPLVDAAITCFVNHHVSFARQTPRSCLVEATGEPTMMHIPRESRHRSRTIESETERCIPEAKRPDRYCFG